MRLHRLTAADRTWREKTDGFSLLGAIIVLIVIGIPLVLL